LKIKAFSVVPFVTVITRRICLKDAFRDDFSQGEVAGRLFILTERLISLSNHITTSRRLDIVRIIDCKDN
jgi:membrane protein CcdC involved in cytochrome C biogenesis